MSKFKRRLKEVEPEQRGTCIVRIYKISVETIMVIPLKTQTEVTDNKDTTKQVQRHRGRTGRIMNNHGYQQKHFNKYLW